MKPTWLKIEQNAACNSSLRTSAWIFSQVTSMHVGMSSRAILQRKSKLYRRYSMQTDAAIATLGAG